MTNKNKRLISIYNKVIVFNRNKKKAYKIVKILLFKNKICKTSKI